MIEGPEIEEEIDEVFLAHDFFADRDVGNGVHDLIEPFRDDNHNRRWDEGEYFTDTAWPNITHDEGESVGNATNYQRPGRRSLPSLPGQFVKVENNVPCYVVEVDLYNQDADNRGIPIWQYDVRVDNSDGMVFLPVPPDPYKATLIVYPENVSADHPLILRSDEFMDYARVVERGYFLDHDFGITGEIPVLPEYPGDIPEATVWAFLIILSTGIWSSFGGANSSRS